MSSDGKYQDNESTKDKDNESSLRSSSEGNWSSSTVDEEKQQRPGRSFLVDWDGDNDPFDPRTFSPVKKWLFVSVIVTGCVLVTAVSSLYAPAIPQITRDFGCSDEVAALGLSLYVLGLAAGPLLCGPLSEFYGRRPIYLVATSMFVVWLIPCAVAKNTETLMVGRFLGGAFGSAFLAVAGGTIVDMFVPQQRLLPMAIFSGAPFLGPAVGPLLGGFICSFTDWRWCFYVSIIWAFIQLVFVVCVPETFHPILLSKKAAALRKSTGDDRYYSASEDARASKTLTSSLLTSLYVPFKLIALDPMIAVLSTYTALLLGILYMFFAAFPLVFQANYGFNLWQVGLTFLGLAIGNFVGCAFTPLWHKRWLASIQKKKQQIGDGYKPEPELRLPPAMVGSVIIAVSLFWFAWTTLPSVHWIVPIIATVFFSIGFFFAFQGVWTFLVDAYPEWAASVMSINATTRCALAAAFPLFTTQMYDGLGFQWATSLIAFLTLAMVPFPFLFYRYGRKLRVMSKFASS